MGRPPRSQKPTSASSDHVLMTVATRIKDARLQLKMTQKQVAEQAGIQHSYLYEIETGTINITLRTLASLAEVLAMDIRALFPETGPGLASPGDGTMLSGVLAKAVWVLEQWEKQDTERHREDAERRKRQSDLLAELKSAVGPENHVDPKHMSVETLSPSEEPHPKTGTRGNKRTGPQPCSH